jgi:hypothetical protein
MDAKKKKPAARRRLLNLLFSFTGDLSTIDEPFNVLLRTSALSRTLSNALHGETSTSSAFTSFFFRPLVISVRPLSASVKGEMTPGKVSVANLVA